jgi:hypothetical protein
MGRAHTLQGLRVDEISLVDAPANPGAMAVLFKRKDPAMPTEAELIDAYMKRDFTADQRKAAAAKGEAMPDGSYPIANRDDLKNAVRAVGRASDPDKAKAHIKSRAKALGCTGDLPDTWKTADAGVLDRLLTRLGIGKRATPETVDPDTYIDAASASVDKATAALAQSIASIQADAAVVDKTGAIEKSLAEFRAFTADAAADQIEKAMRDVALATHVRKDDDVMPTPEEQVATLSKQLADATLELAKAKMNAKHSKFMDGLKNQDAKDKFAAKPHDERESQIAAASDNDADDTKKRDVELTKALGEVADLQKRLATFEADRELDDFRKRASAIGVGDAQAEVLLKASKGDGEAFGKVLDMVKAATTAARTGSIFKEFGGSSGTGGVGSAAAEVTAKAEVLMKAEPTLSPILARVRVRKANAELAQREREEERAASRAAS